MNISYIQRNRDEDQSTETIVDHPQFLEVVGPENYCEVNGDRSITTEGMRRFSLAVLDGTLPGNREIACLFLKQTELIANL